MAGGRKFFGCSSHTSPKIKPINSFSGNFQYSFTFIQRRNERKVLEGKYEEQLKIAIDDTEHMFRTTGDKILHRDSKSTAINFQRSTKKDVSPKKHTLRGPGKKYTSGSEKTKKAEEEGTICPSKPEIRKVESEKDDSDFECYNKSGTHRHRQKIHRRMTGTDITTEQIGRRRNR